MHRSGTSALAGLLNRCGYDIGKNILEPSSDNPKGFYENKKIVELNNKIFLEQETSWDDLYFREFNYDKIIEKFAQTAIDLLENEFNDSQKILIKDPRICILYPFWKHILQLSGINFKCIKIIRNPTEVSLSLEKRDGFSIEKGILLWIKYNLFMLYHTKNTSSPFIRCDEIKDKTVLIEKLSPFINSNKHFSSVYDEFIDIKKFHYKNNDDFISKLPDFLKEIISFIQQDTWEKIDYYYAFYRQITSVFYNKDFREQFPELNKLNRLIEDKSYHLEKSIKWAKSLDIKLNDCVDNYLALKQQNEGIHAENCKLQNKIQILENEQEYLKHLIASYQEKLSVYERFKILRLYGRFFLHLKRHGLKHTAKKIISKVLRKGRQEPYSKPEKSSPLKSDAHGPCSNNIFFFAIIDWKTRNQRPQHICRGLAKSGYRIFYFSPTLGASNEIIINEIEKNIFEIFLPYERKTWIYNENINIENLKEYIIDIIQTFSITNAVIVTQFPLWYNLIQLLKKQFGYKIIFDVLDNFSDFDNVSIAVNEYEQKLALLSDICVCTSDKLASKITKYNSNIEIIKNGTEFNLFNKPVKNEILKNIGKPIIGYYGALEYWFDVELIDYIARKRPHYSFILIGHINTDVQKLEDLPNVFLLGEKYYLDLPKYLYWFDVCIIPFKICELIACTNPVKFYEYLSSGKPVVTTDIPELYPYVDLFYLSKSYEEFLHNIDRAVSEDNPALIQQRKDLARQNDWQERVRAFEKCIQSLFIKDIKVSIIILTYNQLNEATRPCIESIYKFTPLENFELIIVDNNSTDGTQDYLKDLAQKHKNITLVLNAENKGFAAGINDGIKKASGQYVIILNNDVLVTPGWLYKLIQPFRGDNKIGLTSPVTNYAGTEQKIDIPGIDENNYLQKSLEYTEKHLNDHFETRRVSFFCVCLTKDVINKVGYLDEKFSIGMFEDDDYCLRLLNHGYKIVVLEDCFIYHKGSLSFKKLSSKEYMNIFNRNKAYFYEKHKIQWTFSDVALAYLNKFKTDLLDEKTEPKDKILKRIDDFQNLLEHIKNNIELKC